MQIIPIRDLRDTNAISERCNNSNEPIFITKNGYGDMVIMNMQTYERMIAMADVYNKLLVAEKERESGQMLDGASAFSQLRAELV